MYYPAKFSQEDGAYIVTFRDVPESITQGGNFEEAMFLAEDVLICGLEFYFENDKPIPLPSEPQADEIMVYLSDIVYVKALLHNARLETEMSKAELARFMDVRPPEMQRILDPRHNTKLDTISRMLSKLGRPLKLSIE
ncbi:type II toxin-antitoxin system HicB family antitoxin [Haemophilus parahaemolyticus]|uniref:Type II toxin-antitoxin system HicB family antitoxin n=1 Tax=Haemophilus parahaemolyticus TaxID=735 RepID=A0A369Z659_HAEPH|nr:type II toxin-antitoxin system HicB family antitoxin [Haemophilus parahaemolyticus]RDE99860.1 type II toxin-antitoxin system HicB family antitoxin [Haemophilus parahaemolyticus]